MSGLDVSSLIRTGVTPLNRTDYALSKESQWDKEKGAFAPEFRRQMMKLVCVG
jgi:hypothetical protein